MPDAHKNFAYSTVLVAPSPATSGTSLTVFTGQGALFPAAPFNAVVWPTGTNPLASNAEIVRVTAIAGDVFTITRAQESTTARTVLIGDNIAASITAKTLEDVEFPAVTQAEAEAGTVTAIRNWTPQRVAQAIAALSPSGGSGDVVGPASSTADRIATFDGITGKLIKDGGASIAGILSDAATDATTKANAAQAAAEATAAADATTKASAAQSAATSAAATDATTKANAAQSAAISAAATDATTKANAAQSAATSAAATDATTKANAAQSAAEATAASDATTKANAAQSAAISAAATDATTKANAAQAAAIAGSQKIITSGTAAPSGGSDGDIYLQYT
jgi:hypothetical protein